MSLATQCPHCKTTFRVAQDQLKLRAGLVRCGACREIFNGIEHLLTADESEPLSQQTARTAAEPESTAASPATELDFAYPDFDFAGAAAPESATDTVVADFTARDSAANIDSVDYVETPKSNQATPSKAAPLDLEPLPSALSGDETYTIEPLPAEPYLAEIEQMEAELSVPMEFAEEDAMSETDGQENDDGEQSGGGELADHLSTSSETEEPDFVRRGRRKQRLGHAMRIGMATASVLLLLAACAQTVFAFRDQIAARMPQARPALVRACIMLRCQIGLPAQIDSLSIESHALETLSANKDDSELTLSLRNMSNVAQAWPDIELTLNDANGVLLARRIFAPGEYLANDQDAKRELAQGLAAGSEQPIKLFISFADAKPADYRVGVFYP